MGLLSLLIDQNWVTCPFPSQSVTGKDREWPLCYSGLRSLLPWGRVGEDVVTPHCSAQPSWDGFSSCLQHICATPWLTLYDLASSGPPKCLPLPVSLLHAVPSPWNAFPILCLSPHLCLATSSCPLSFRPDTISIGRPHLVPQIRSRAP